MVPPYEPIGKASLRHTTVKTAFLLALATSSRRSELHAIQWDDRHVVLSKEKGNEVVTLWTCKDSGSNRKPSAPTTPMVVPSLESQVDKGSPRMKLCPVRALKAYIKATHDHSMRRANGLSKLFLPYEQGARSPLSLQAMSKYIVEPVKLAYPGFADDLDIHAHQVRGMSASVAHSKGVPLDTILAAATWKSPTVFMEFYLKDMAATVEGIPPVVVAQTALGGAVGSKGSS